VRTSANQTLLLETRAPRTARPQIREPIVRADFRECFVTPAMTASIHFIGFGFEDLVGKGGDVKFFRAKMFADVGWLHNQAMSCASVRRTRARTSATL
jgi:hypothetical protein